MTRYTTTKTLLLAFVCAIGVLFALPNFFSDEWRTAHWPSFLPQQTVNLGLDLQGGSHLVLQVGLDELGKEFAAEKRADATRLLRAKNLEAVSVAQEGMTLLFRFDALDKAENAANALKADNANPLAVSVDDVTVSLALSPVELKAMEDAALARSLEIIRGRIDATGTKEPVIQRQGRDQIVVQLPGVQDPARVKALIGKTAKLSFHLVNEDIGANGITNNNNSPLPANTQFFPFIERNTTGALAAQKTYIAVYRRAMVAGEDLIDSRGTFQENRPVVSFRFNTSGAKKFGKATTENVQKLFAIVLDGEVISAPRINEPIVGGSGVISGNFTAKSAEDLALLLRSGALPVPLVVIEERTVGPGLGADSIAAGTNAAAVSLVATIVFMIAVYGLFGGFATIAVVFNLVLMLAVMSVLGATLTLPGLAGIVLTIGMAVDANVLIYERIREEATLGRSVTAALETGFSRVLSTIVDANVTTLISALMLYTFGSGPVKGFAVTLAVGILTSMFTAVVLTRYMVVSWLHATKPKKLPI